MNKFRVRIQYIQCHTLLIYLQKALLIGNAQKLLVARVIYAVYI